MNKTVYVPVSDARGNILQPCPPKRARQLLASGRVAPHWLHGIFGVRLVDKVVPTKEINRNAVIAVDPGSEHTGVAVYRQNGRGRRRVLLTMQIDHRGNEIKDQMRKRRNYRRGRRSRLRLAARPGF